MLSFIEQSMKQTFFNYNLDPNLSINDFYVGIANIDAFNFLIKKNEYNNQIFLFGPKKSGKTHLSLIWQNKNNAIKYNNNMTDILNKKRNILIDDMFFDLNEENMFYLINHSKLYNLKILITSSTPLNSYAFELADLSSRLRAFYYISINLPDDQLLVNLMIKLFHDKQIIVKNLEIFNYIIKRVGRSYENIFTLVDQIDKLLLQKNKQLTIPIIKELI